jgi:hypothetical protein
MLGRRAHSRKLYTPIDRMKRFMGLNDLMSEIKQDPTSFTGDEITENKVLRQVLALVEDKISEVKNQAVKWYHCACVVIGCSCLKNFYFGFQPGSPRKDHSRTSVRIYD